MEEYSKTILEEMNLSPTFAEWSIDLVKDGLTKNILEIGCGIGRNLIHLQKISKDLSATDFNLEYLKNVESIFPGMKNKLFEWNLNEQFTIDINADSFFCSNVIEHIHNDSLAISNISKIQSIKKGVFIVPGISRIYNELDTVLGHYRRYDINNFREKLFENGFNVKRIISFNKIGVLGWYTQGSLLRKKTLGKNNMKIYNIILPMVKILDPYLPFCGLSIAALVEKN